MVRDPGPSIKVGEGSASKEACGLCWASQGPCLGAGCGQASPPGRWGPAVALVGQNAVADSLSTVGGSAHFSGPQKCSRAKEMLP